MGLAHSPCIVTDGLVLSLDAGNSKSYNSTISTNWTDNFGGNNGTLNGGIHHTDGPFVGAGYVEFDGSGDYLDISGTVSDYSFGTGDYTVECFAYFKSVSSTLQILYGSGGSSNTFFFHIDQDQISVGTESVFVSNQTTTIAAGRWYHLVACRSSGTLRLFVNGIQAGSDVSDSTNWSSSGTARIGASSVILSQYVHGYISNLRVIKGTALYTSNFTPSTKPLTAITNTVLLTCQGNSISDASSSGHTITVNGDATANLGFPASAFEFDGVNDFVAINQTLSIPFTISGFIRYTDQSKRENTFINTNPHTVLGISLNRTGVGDLHVFIGNGSSWVAAPGIISSSNMLVNTWYHLTFTSNGSGSTLYLNGVNVGTSIYSPSGWGSTYYLGSILVSGGEYLRGNIATTQIYNRALTAAEVQQNFNALRGRFGI